MTREDLDVGTIYDVCKLIVGLRGIKLIEEVYLSLISNLAGFNLNFMTGTS